MKEMKTAICGSCGRKHEVTKADIHEFGSRVECLPCTERKHVTFMRKSAKKLGLSCVKGCFCGYGK